MLNSTVDFGYRTRPFPAHSRLRRTLPRRDPFLPDLKRFRSHLPRIASRNSLRLINLHPRRSQALSFHISLQNMGYIPSSIPSPVFPSLISLQGRARTASHFVLSSFTTSLAGTPRLAKTLGQPIRLGPTPILCLLNFQSSPRFLLAPSPRKMNVGKRPCLPKRSR